MERYTELLYWVQYDDCFSFNEVDETIHIAPGTPKRAVDSFISWLEENEEDTGKVVQE